MSKNTFLILFIFFTTKLLAQNVKVIQSEPIFSKAPFKACHAFTLVELKNGRILVAWFGGKFEGSKDVTIWSSIGKNGKWSHPVEIANGIQKDTTRYACWNPVLFRAKNGILYLHYKVGPNPREWWAEYKTSSNDGETWSEAIKLPKALLGPIKNKPIQIADGSILYPSSTESIDEKTWKVHIEKSDFNGKNWRRINIDSDTFGVIQPSILYYANGKLQILGRSRQNVIVESWSVDQGETWSKLAAISLPNPNSGSDAVTLQDGRKLLIYNPLTSGKNWWDGRSVLKLAISQDGQNWKDIYTLEDHKKGEYSYPAIIQSNNGMVHVTYTAERNQIKHVALSLLN